MCDAVAYTNFELMLTKVEEEDIDFAVVIVINNTSTSHKSKLGGETALRGDATVGAFGDDDRELCINWNPASNWDNLGLCAMKVVTGSLVQAAKQEMSNIRMSINS